jgi:hypothetical protein
MKAAPNSQPRVRALGRIRGTWQEKAMKPIALPFIALALAACGQPSDSLPANKAIEANPAPPAPPPAPEAKAFSFDEKNDLIEFHFAWSAEAAAVPQLVSRFQAEMTKAKDELRAGAKEDKAFRDKEGYDFNGYQSSTDYKTSGQSERLLSLTSDVGSYTGGAHGNYGTGGLLWDRQAAIEIKVADLFSASANRDRLLTQRWCDALNKEREKKRGEPVTGNDMFDECPKLEDIAIVPTDKDGNGKFERLILTASPYVAGPYAEGSYEIDLAVTVDLIAALKSDYRASFEAGQPQ